MPMPRFDLVCWIELILLIALWGCAFYMTWGGVQREHKKQTALKEVQSKVIYIYPQDRRSDAS